MRKSAIIIAAVGVGLLALPARSIASDHGPKLPSHFEATLVGLQENPSISTPPTTPAVRAARRYGEGLPDPFEGE